MLCYRCEHRAEFLSNHGRRPRSECGNVNASQSGCYMYQPCRPVVVKKNKGDKRPLFGPAMIAARYSAVRVADDMELNVHKNGGEHTLYWRPKSCLP